MKTSKTNFSVEWAENDGSQTPIRRFHDQRVAELYYDMMQKSPKRNGRGLMLSKDVYEKDIAGDWVCVSSDTLDGEGGKDWQ